MRPPVVRPPTLDDARTLGIAHAFAVASGDDAAIDRHERALVALGELFGDPLTVAIEAGRASVETSRTLARAERLGKALILVRDAARVAREGGER